jgi:VWFA-related protein
MGKVTRLRKRSKPPLLPAVRELLVLLAASVALVPGRGLFAQSVPADELSSKESEPTFKVQVERNLVLVRAVVRDGQGRAVKGLTKEDFRIFDNGKLQTISQFSVETPASAASPAAAAPGAPRTEEVQPESALAPEAPRRFLGLYFDDVHLPVGDVLRVRLAAQQYLNSALRVGDRAGIFTASGQGVLDFTGDRARLDQALLRLQARPIRQQEMHPCPPLLDYQAYLMVHERDTQALDLATQETLECRHLNDSTSAAAQAEVEQVAASQAEAAAYARLNQFETESEDVLRELDHLEMRMALLPGQRNIVLISPGFLTLTLGDRLSRLVDRALRSKIVINSVDARGLYSEAPMGDITRDPTILPRRPDLMGQEELFRIRQGQRESEPLSQLAGDTGGVYFHNSNDLLRGLRQAGNLPEVYYLLSFSPQPLKYDGRFHTLKVKLVPSRRLEVEARRGYFAPAQAQDAAARAQEQIRQAIFSQDNLRGIPIEVHTQFFKRDEMNADLAVLTRVDLRFIPFQKQDGLNLNRLTVVTVLFDQNGNYVAGKEKQLIFRMRDVTLAELSQTGLAMRTRFDVKPGTYLVREVVEDAEGARLSGLTRTVEIPY